MQHLTKQIITYTFKILCINSINKDYGIMFGFFSKFTRTAPSFWAITFLGEYQHFTKRIGISSSDSLSIKGILPTCSLRCTALKPLPSQQQVAISKQTTCQAALNVLEICHRP